MTYSNFNFNSNPVVFNGNKVKKTKLKTDISPYFKAFVNCQVCQAVLSL